MSYDFNPNMNFNPATNKPDSSAYYAPYQGYGGINTVSTRLWQEWNGLEVQVKHPVAKSLNVTGAYTWSHNTTNLGSIDPYDLNRFHGNAESLNYPQSVAITVIYRLPSLEHSNGFVKNVLGGWSFDDITTFRSGTSLTPSLGEPAGLALRPDQVPGATYRWSEDMEERIEPPISGSTHRRFLPGSVDGAGNCGTSRTSYGLYGHVQTGIIRGPGQEIYNMALFKTFDILEKAHLEFRAEAFNAFNHTNPSNPNTSLSSSSYGKITGALDPRIMELALRLKF